MTPLGPTVIRQARPNSVLVSLLGGQQCVASNFGILVPLRKTASLPVCSAALDVVATNQSVMRCHPVAPPDCFHLGTLSCRRLTIHIAPSSFPLSSLSTSYLSLFSLANPPTSAHPEAIVVYISSPKVSSNRRIKTRDGLPLISSDTPSVPRPDPCDPTFHPPSSLPSVFLSCTNGLSMSCGVAKNRKLEKIVHGKTSLHSDLFSIFDGP